MSSASGISAASGELASQVTIAVAKKSQDAAKAQGEAVVQLLQDAANLAKAAGKGGSFDAVG
ncbi:MAG: putative motility protein [Pirellulales bacterium]